jgi:hypothetical protein
MYLSIILDIKNHTTHLASLCVRLLRKRRTLFSCNTNRWLACFFLIVTPCTIQDLYLFAFQKLFSLEWNAVGECEVG